MHNTQASSLVYRGDNEAINKAENKAKLFLWSTIPQKQNNLLSVYLC